MPGRMNKKRPPPRTQGFAFDALLSVCGIIGFCGGSPGQIDPFGKKVLLTGPRIVIYQQREGLKAEDRCLVFKAVYFTTLNRNR